MKKYFHLLFCFVLSFYAIAQTKPALTKIVAGPMLGYAEHKECMVWIQTSCSKTVTLKYLELNGLSEGEMTITNKNENLCLPWISKFIISDLKPNTTYTYEILLDKKLVPFT